MSVNATTPALSARARWFRRGGFMGVALLACLSFFATRPDLILWAVSGMTSHVVCSGLFVSGLDPESTFQDVLRPQPGMGVLAPLIRYRVDLPRREVTTEVGTFFATRAHFREGLGCLAAPKSEAFGSGHQVTYRRTTAPGAAETATAGSPDVEAILDRAFKDVGRKNLAIVVRHKGRIVGERYARGVGRQTPLLGWSLTKTVTAAMVGVLVRNGRLDVNAPAPVALWRQGDDPRRSITIDHLLRMTSGLDLRESSSVATAASWSLFLAPDTAEAGARAPLRDPPGRTFRLTSGSTLIVGGVIRDAVGGRSQDVLDFAWREIFGPLGMREVVLEFDRAGTPLGSTFMYASARDWAKFGALFLDDGVVNGRRILPKGWVAYLATPGSADYGASAWPGRRWGLPPGSLVASGFLGQRLAVIPSEDLVIARLANDHSRDSFEGLIRAVRRALAPGPNP